MRGVAVEITRVTGGLGRCAQQFGRHDDEEVNVT